MSHRRSHVLLWSASIGLAAASIPSAAHAGKSVSFFLEPFIGVTAATLNALEVENAFVVSKPSADGEDPTAEDDWTQVDPSSYRTPVGRRAYYEGRGFSCGGALGVRLFAVQLGVSYIHDGLRLEGFSKRYRYSVDRMKAVGHRFNDEGLADFHRVVALVRYILPFWKMQLELTTRLGGVFVDEGPLIVGRAIDEERGFTGDLGAGLGYSPVRMLTLRATGYYGFYTFSGQYDGAYGMIGGFEFAIGLSI
jgi:hypothetical protein